MMEKSLEAEWAGRGKDPPGQWRPGEGLTRIAPRTFGASLSEQRNWSGEV